MWSSSFASPPSRQNSPIDRVVLTNTLPLPENKKFPKVEVLSVAKIIAVMIIIITGLTLAFGDTSGGARKLIQIVFGLSIAFAASSFFLSFFSFGGGALV